MILMLKAFKIFWKLTESKIDKLFYASSSSVYNENDAAVFKEENVGENQLSVYGTTKRKNSNT